MQLPIQYRKSRKSNLNLTSKINVISSPQLHQSGFLMQGNVGTANTDIQPTYDLNLTFLRTLGVTAVIAPHDFVVGHVHRVRCCERTPRFWINS